MQVLKPLTLLCLLYNSLLVAEDSTLKDYISKNKKEQFKYEYEKNEAEASKLRDSWIAPLQLQYIYSRSKPGAKELTRENTAIIMDQPIFQSGGIYYGIKFANASKKYLDYSVEVAQVKMIKVTLSILMQIKQSTLKVKSQKLKIQNAEINLKLKRDQYLSGQLDSGFLDDAMIERNRVISLLYDLQTSKELLVTSFKTLSDSPYETLNIPHFSLMSEDEFMQYNLAVKQSQAEVEKSDYSRDIIRSKYLPKVNLTAGYTWSSNEQFIDNDLTFKTNIASYNYGLKASMPLDINSFRDMESAKVDFLKSKVVVEDKRREQKALFLQTLYSIDNYEKKIALAQDNIEIYTKLLEDTKELFTAGYKTEYDVTLLNNSLELQKYDTQVYEIDKQLSLLELYEVYMNDVKGNR
ncbi:TolC family protein [Sulfurimonas sp.]|jgi:outer membrane protein TolC|uniref:TolC family protein n=1 Tax=Sulfurimonas sp. TaxID=2022749 RepID=UPI0025E491DB|nr:TolC family protein [Sulfurimonas sp.]MBT5934835.1 TolC family protein [Sulfurimonas sp.]